MTARGGRKPKYTPELAQAVIDGITAGLTDKDAARSAGISEDTLARWMKGQRGASADLAERLTRAREADATDAPQHSAGGARPDRAG